MAGSDSMGDLQRLGLERFYSHLLSYSLITLCGQLGELPSPSLPNRIAAAFVSPTACSIYSIGNSVSWVYLNPISDFPYCQMHDFYSDLL